MSRPPQVDYDSIAPRYDERTASSYLSGIPAALILLARRVRAQCILDLGCGTGRSLQGIAEGLETKPVCFGLDSSTGMLAQARHLDSSYKLVQATASMPPFIPATFQVVFCVHAFHHFPDKVGVVGEAFDLLCPGGAFAIVSIDPRECSQDDYIYKYFQGTYETDLARFPSMSDIETMLHDAGFEEIQSPVVQEIDEASQGEAIFDCYFLQKNSSSQLILLSDEEYRLGLRRIQEEVSEAKARNWKAIFQTRMMNRMFHGFKPN